MMSRSSSDNLAVFADDSFDAIVAILVLQHIEQLYTLRYLREFLRILRPRGLLFFQLPIRVLNSTPHWQANGDRTDAVVEAPLPAAGHGEGKGQGEGELHSEAARTTEVQAPFTVQTEAGSPRPVLEMHTISRREVEEFLTNAGGRVLRVGEDSLAGSRFVSRHYFVTKDA